MEALIALFVANAPVILDIAIKAVALGAAVATVTPNTSDNKVFDVLYKLINKLALNFGKSTNA